ncbi:MAG TPA: DUF58 domain-containing protein [Pirellulales bacterium]
MSVASASRFLDLRGLASTEHMRFTTRHRLDGAFIGRHASRQQGGSGEFVDYREYTDGEDLRRIDWKVLSRTGRAYLRLYQDETNLRCTLALDASGSMRFGAQGGDQTSGSKLDYACYLATALAHVIQRGQDQVGLAVIGQTLEHYLPPAGTPTHVARLYETIEKIGTTPGLQLAGGLGQLFGRVHRRGVLLVFSDFLVDDLEETFAALRLFRHRRWEVIVLHLVHPDEERLPEGRAFRFEGLENEGALNCSPAEIRQEYEALFERHAAVVRTMALGCGCDYRRISTAVPYLQTLDGFLLKRSG